MIKYTNIKTGKEEYFNPNHVEDTERTKRRMTQLGKGQPVDNKVLLVWMVSGKAVWVDPDNSPEVDRWLERDRPYIDIGKAAEIYWETIRKSLEVKGGAL